MPPSSLYARYPQAFGALDQLAGAILAAAAGLLSPAAEAHEAENCDTIQVALATLEMIGCRDPDTANITADQGIPATSGTERPST